jgi:hypothetical protein
MGYYWVIVTGIAAVYVFLSFTLPYKLRKNKLNIREDMTFDEIYNVFFKGSTFEKKMLNDLWTETCKMLDLPETKLRPTDRFEKELSCSYFPTVDLNERLTDHLRKKLVGISARACPSSIITLGEFILFSAQLVMKEGKGNGVNH